MNDHENQASPTEGYILQAEALRDERARQNLKTSRGRQVLIPQPSDDPTDALNWKQRKKNLVLFIVTACAFLPDYGSAIGAVDLLPQSKEWKISPDTVNHSQVGNIFMLGAGGILVAVFGAYFGRLPVMFWFLVFSLWTAAWCAGAHSFEDFMAARILNGFFSVVGEVAGLMFIRDMFFFHEHARKINFWGSFIIISPYLGPLLSAFIISTQNWRWTFGVYSIMNALGLLALILFVDETYYDRSIPMEKQPERRSRFLRLIGIEQWRSRAQRNTFREAVMRPLKVIGKPTVFLSDFYYLVSFAWVIGINTTLSVFVTPIYNFGPLQIGYFYFTPIVSAILGQIAGHWLHDYIAILYSRRHKGRVDPEARLFAIWIATPFIIAGLVLYGFSLQRRYHYMLTSLGWGLYVFGILISTVAVSAYNLDSYPEGSGEASAWVNFSRVAGGFIVSYFQIRWAKALGPELCFGIQAAICLGVFLIAVALQIWGKSLRHWAGPLDFKTG